MASSHPLIDHDEIRHWAEARHAQPACVRGTGGKGDPGMIRLDFPGFTGAQSLSPISWDAWFKSFDRNGLALLVQDKTARGQQSNFNKLVTRETVTGGAPQRRKRKTTSTSRSTQSAAPASRTRATRSTRPSSLTKTSGGTSTRSTSARASASDRSTRTTASGTKRSSGRTSGQRKTGTSSTRSKRRR